MIAEWTSAGACLTADTLSVGGTCGSSFASGATLIDELPAF